ncbi:MAG TPA: dienelactone hydrolase family protein [Gemmatimonadales bacterium]|nr:dienelactone hydrolase family protein [Gemmatimonadales bacterium]
MALTRAPARLVRTGAALTCLAALAAAPSARAQDPPALQTITFPSADSLPITADLYAPHPPTAPFIVLFHQAEWSRGEYREIAPRLVEMGFNCMAVDARAGDAVEGVVNETARRAEAAGRPHDMLDAAQDIEAGVRYARRHWAHGALVAWGSSYSASLVLRLAGTKPWLVNGVVAFSPGEYFTDPPGEPHYVADAAKHIVVPVLITSARSEEGDWREIYAAISPSLRRRYLPDSPGRHGSSALWKRTSGQEGYWQAVRGFLNMRFSHGR